MSFRMTFAAVGLMYAAAFFMGSAADAGEYDDRLAKALKAQERLATKIEKLRGCVANPAPCASEDEAKASKAFERAKARFEKAQAVKASSSSTDDESN